MRSALLIGCLLWAAICVHSMTRVEFPSSIHKRAAPQVLPQPTHSNNQTQFQWVKVDNQWVRRDGTKLPGYSQANVPYNQSASWNTPTRNAAPTQPNAVNNAQRPAIQSTPSGRPVQQAQQQPSHQASPPRSPSQHSPPRPQSPASQGGLGWNPDADRALTQDLPKTTPRPVVAPATTQRPVVPQTPPPAHKPATPPVQPPFGAGAGGVYQRQPSNKYNPDASLTYGLQSGQTPPSHRGRTTPIPNVGRSGTNPWGGLFTR